MATRAHPAHRRLFPFGKLRILCYYILKLVKGTGRETGARPFLPVLVLVLVLGRGGSLEVVKARRKFMDNENAER